MLNNVGGSTKCGSMVNMNKKKKIEMYLHYIYLTSSIYNYLYFSLVIGVLKVKLGIVLIFEPSMTINSRLIYVVSYYDKNLHQVQLTYLCKSTIHCGCDY